MYTFYQTWCDVHFDYKNFTIQVDLSYQRLRQAWLSYLKLLDIDFNDGFSCSHCDGDDGMPETIVCDGTSFSFQRRMWDWNEKSEPENVLTLSSSKYVWIWYLYFWDIAFCCHMLLSVVTFKNIFCSETVELIGT